MARRCCSPEAFRIILWMCWVMNLLITTIYYLLSFATFYKLLQASNEVLLPRGTVATAGGTSALSALQVDASLIMNRLWRAPLAACLLGGLLVFGFNMFSCIILVKKSINRSGPGFGYGFMVAFCFTLSFFLLLVALIMDSFRGSLKKILEDSGIKSWSKYSTEMYVGAEVFAILCFIMLLSFFFCLVIFQSAVSDQLGISGDMTNPYAPMGPDAGAIALASGGALGAGKAGDLAGPSQYSGYVAPEPASDSPYYQGAQAYQQAPDYQNTTEYQTTEYTYEQEPGYQGQYNADDTYEGGFDNNAAPPAYNAAASYQPPAGAAPAYQSSDFNPTAAFHSQQGAFAGGSQTATHQQL